MSDRDELEEHTAKFDVGHVVATPGAIVALEFNDVSPVELLRRHITGDWGDLDDFDKASNELALQDGSRLLSAYMLADGERIWIITESDRSATTLLLPPEY